MKKIKLEILGLSPSQSQQGSFALILGEEMGNRRLPIIIGVFEAQAIAVHIENISPNRPMTHDLFKSFGEAMNFTIKEIVISDLKEGIFFAKILVGDSIGTREIDARPSDAIAIGIRFGAPIYTNESILTEAGIVSNAMEEEEQEEETGIRTSKKGKPSAEPISETPTEDLKKMLDEALAHEDYEKAAAIRDEISKRN